MGHMLIEAVREAQDCRLAGALDIAGSVVCLTGVVQSIQFDPNRATGIEWRVEMELSTGASKPQTPKVRQRKAL